MKPVLVYLLITPLLLFIASGRSVTPAHAIPAALAVMPAATTLLRGDDPCIYRPSVLRFFCDTARDGGDAEFVVAFGVAGDIPLLGDVNGDGRDDPCIYRPSVLRFFCDTARDGGDAEFVVAFGVAGDIPLLGDVNGDGRDDPCVYRPSVLRFFCDTARDGGDAEFVVAFGITDDIPLIGNVGRPFGVALPLVIR